MPDLESPPDRRDAGGAGAPAPEEPAPEEPAESAPQESATENDSEAWLLTDVVTRLRRVLRSSVRSDYSWETLPMAQVEVLQRLFEEPDLRVSELARRHRLAPNTVSALVQQMVTAKLITRVVDEADRRAVSLRLTDLGARRLEGWSSANQRRITQALERLPRNDRDLIRAALPSLTTLATELEQTELEQVERRSQSPDNVD